MKKTFETDEIKMELDIEERELVARVTLKDEEVFPSLDIENKEKMARFMSLFSGHIMNVLSNATFHRRTAPIDGTPIVAAAPGKKLICEKCGSPLSVKKPCCGQKVGQAECTNPKCRWRISVRWEI